MNNCQRGVSVALLFLLMIIVACVPVEEKVETPFDNSLQNEAVRHIYNLQNSQQRDSLRYYLKHEDPSVRFAAARAFTSFQDSSSMDQLLPLLSDPHNEVRAIAAEAIGLIGFRGAEAALTAAFDGRDSARLYEQANGAILEAMGRVGGMQSLKALSTISTYRHVDTLLLLGQVRGLYRYALRDMVDPEGTNTMVRYLSDRDMPYEVRLIAGNYLHRSANLSLAKKADQIIALWNNESDPYLRICLATALGKIQTPVAKDLLVSALPNETDYRVKCSILRALQTYDYDDVSKLIIEYSKSANPAVAEVAAQYFVTQGKEKDAGLYKAAIEECKTWQAKTRMAEAANKHMTSMFSAPKTALQKEILALLNSTTDVYQKAAWLKAWAAELRNFESIPKYTTSENHVVIRTQAVQSLIDAPRDKNFDTYFAGEGHLIRSQIAGYLANAMRSGDAGILAIIASAITDPKTGLKEVMRDQKNEMQKAMSNLKLPAEMETYLELSKALKEYDVDSPALPESSRAVKSVDWTIVDKIGSSSVRISTSKGEIDLALYADRAPGTVSNFIQLVEQQFYNGKAVHRVVPNFVMQTGCPRGDGFGNLDFTIRSELSGAYYNDEGYIGMASAGPHTEGTQWFITHSPTPHLDGRYTIFGKVTSGMDVVHRIGIGDTIRQITITY